MLIKRKCLNCHEGFEALHPCRGKYDNVYCTPKCRTQAGALRNYHRRNVTTEDHQRYSLKKRYGITPKDVEEIKAVQKNKCAICAKEEKLFVDHCHKTKKIRGLLCYHCNFGIGHFRDEEILLKNAITYLKRTAYFEEKTEASQKS